MANRYRGTAAERRALDAWVKLARSTSTVRSRLESGLGELGLTERELGVLEVLLHVGPVSQVELGRKLLTSRANVTLLVEKLEDRGWLRRECDPKDRRAHRVSLTAAGRRFIEEVFPRHAADVAAALSPLTAAEQRELARLCRKLGRGGD